MFVLVHCIITVGYLPLRVLRGNVIVQGLKRWAHVRVWLSAARYTLDSLGVRSIQGLRPTGPQTYHESMQDLSVAVL